MEHVVKAKTVSRGETQRDSSFSFKENTFIILGSLDTEELCSHEEEEVSADISDDGRVVLENISEEDEEVSGEEESDTGRAGAEMDQR